MPAPGPSAGMATLRLRARVMAAVREFFAAEGYLEVETPIRIPTPAPEAHIDPQTSGDWVLHPSPELCMKRLLAAGHRRIFQICKCFRRGERGRRHLPEMTMLEWYTAEATYERMMDQCEALLTWVCGTLKRGPEITCQGRTITMAPPWERLTVAEAFARYTDLSMAAALAENRFDELMGLEIEPRLGLDRPVFLMDYPAACGALARPKPDHPDLVERFELYIGGLELCNAFGELTDPAEQRRRFETAKEERRAMGKTTHPLPEPFLADLAAMPPAAGNALGLDRLVMLLADVDCIDKVVAFTPESL